VRATRRWRELNAKGINITLEEVRKQVQRRDQLDSERELSPLRVPEDAHIIDTSKRSLDEVVNVILAVIEDQRAC
jgi:cytidylate kinase